MKLKARDTWGIRDAIEARQFLRAGDNVIGFKGTYHDPGSLSDEERSWLEHDLATGDIDYVVISYETPIAWHRRERGWYVVNEYFSTTTSRLQNIVRSVAEWEAKADED